MADESVPKSDHLEAIKAIGNRNVRLALLAIVLASGWISTAILWHNDVASLTEPETPPTPPSPEPVKTPPAPVDPVKAPLKPGELHDVLGPKGNEVEPQPAIPEPPKPGEPEPVTEKPRFKPRVPETPPMDETAKLNLEQLAKHSTKVAIVEEGGVKYDAYTGKSGNVYKFPHRG